MTGNQLFQYAIDLCGLRSSATDSPADVGDLSRRAVSLINVLLSENSSIDGRIRKSKQEILSITDLTEELPCSEIIASSVLPYGLARLFMLGEDDSLAGDLERLYKESKVEALKFGNVAHKSITEVYS